MWIEFSGSVEFVGLIYYLLIGVDVSKFDFDKLWYWYCLIFEDICYVINMYNLVYGKVVFEGFFLFNSIEV